MVSIVRNPDSAYLDYSPYYEEEWQYYYDYILDMIPKGSSVLDIGCGQGFLSSHLKDIHKCSVVSVDISEKAVALCREKGLEAYCKDVEIDSMNGKYDFVVMAACVEHMIYPKATLEKIKDNLNHNGQIIIVVPNTTDMLSRLRFLSGRCVQQPLGELFTDNIHGLQASGHLHFYNKYTLNLFLNKLGYRPMQWLFTSYNQAKYNEHSVFLYPFVWLYHYMYKHVGGSLFSELIIVRAKYEI